MNSKIYDVIVIGSGPAGAHAALPLVEAGVKVALLDGGVKQTQDFLGQEGESFEDIRRKRTDQHELFLGTDLSGAQPPSKEQGHSGHMSSGRFSYVMQHTAEILPLRVKGIEIAQTLAKGGLTEVWGGACDVLTDQELESLGLHHTGLSKYYQEVIDRIGISGDLPGYKTQPRSKTESHFCLILKRAFRKRKKLESVHMRVKSSLLALLTCDLGKRREAIYDDANYWKNTGNSLYQARFTIEEMEEKNNFSYVSNTVVRSLKEEKDKVVILAQDFLGNEKIYRARHVIVAAGALNTIRILSKTYDLYNKRIPIITKPHIITPCIDVRFLGKKGDVKRHSLCQMVMESTVLSEGLGKSYSQFYNYKSLLLFKLLSFSPLSYPESFSILSMIVPSMVLMDTRFPSTAHRKKYCILKKASKGDILHIEYTMGKREHELMRQEMQKVKRAARILGLLPVKDVYMPEGSSAHYAGGVPITADTQSPLRADRNGRVNNSKRIYCADAALWKALPAKPPTLTMMANARRIGTELAKKL